MTVRRVWKKILLNLSQVSFMDSAGVGELVAGLRTARNVGASLKLLNTNERILPLYIARLLPISRSSAAKPRHSRLSPGGLVGSLFGGQATFWVARNHLEFHRALRAVHGFAHLDVVAVELRSDSQSGQRVMPPPACDDVPSQVSGSRPGIKR